MSPTAPFRCQAPNTSLRDLSALETGEDAVDLLLRRRHGPQEDGVLLDPEHVVDVRLQLPGRETAIALRDSCCVVRVRAEGHPDRVAWMEREQTAVRGVPLYDSELRRIGRDAVAEPAQARRSRRGLVDRRLCVAARREDGQENEEADRQPHCAATVPRQARRDTGAGAPVSRTREPARRQELD